RTVVHAYSFRLKGASDQILRNAVSFANVVNGTGSLVLTDDLEIYHRLDLGMSSEGCEWLQIGRGYQSDVPDAHGGRRGKHSPSGVYTRNMLGAWLALMPKGHAAPVRAASCRFQARHGETTQPQGKAGRAESAPAAGAASPGPASGQRAARPCSL